MSIDWQAWWLLKFPSAHDFLHQVSLVLTADSLKLRTTSSVTGRVAAIRMCVDAAFGAHDIQLFIVKLCGKNSGVSL